MNCSELKEFIKENKLEWYLFLRGKTKRMHIIFCSPTFIIESYVWEHKISVICRKYDDFISVDFDTEGFGKIMSNKILRLAINEFLIFLKSSERNVWYKELNEFYHRNIDKLFGRKLVKEW